MKIKLILLLLLSTSVSAVELRGANGEYLGQLGGSKFSEDSTNNPYGQYGSKYSNESINNPYSEYGSQYSNQSPNNPYTLTPPVIRNEVGLE
jgi:hypothetical protein